MIVGRSGGGSSEEDNPEGCLIGVGERRHLRNFKIPANRADALAGHSEDASPRGAATSSGAPPAAEIGGGAGVAAGSDQGGDAPFITFAGWPRRLARGSEVLDGPVVGEGH